MTIKHAHSMSGCLRQAVDNGIIRENPLKKTARPKITKKEIEIFTQDEVKSLIAAAEKYANPAIIPIAYSTGMRMSELLDSVVNRYYDIMEKTREVILHDKRAAQT